MCHQVEDKNLGSPESFSGQYSVNLTAQPGERPLYGPFKLDQQWLDVKKQATGYLATQTEHLAKPELCAICHTLHTPIIGPDGKPTGNVFPEQMQYLEWQNSIYKNGVTCQNCHMPVLNSDARLTGLGTPDRPAVNQHQFLGSNAYMMTLLEANTEEIFVNASPEELKAAAQRNLEFLQNRAAAINLTGQIEGGDLILEVKLNNMAGHKMPSGFPSRRAWLHLSVTDAGGQVLFESGEWDTASGKITGNDNDTDASQFEPHYDVITLPDQVQIYEAILGTSEAKVTTELIKSFSYLKDNRLLPSGFDKANAGKDILVAGEALVDDNFTGGSDTVTYRIPTGQANRPFTVSVELAFQTIGYRWGLNVSEEETEEAAAFRRYFMQTPPEPAILIRAEKRIE